MANRSDFIPGARLQILPAKASAVPNIFSMQMDPLIGFTTSQIGFGPQVEICTGDVVQVVTGPKKTDGINLVTVEKNGVLLAVYYGPLKVRSVRI